MGSGVDSLVCLNKTNTVCRLCVFLGATRFFILLCLLVLTFIPVDFLTSSLSVLCSVFSPICWPNDQPHLPASKISLARILWQGCGQHTVPGLVN